jgi:hypothetical protein
MVHIRVTRRMVTSEQTGGRELRINCPACGAKNVPATAWFEDEVANLIWRLTTSWVQCSACGAKLYSCERADTLFAYTPEQLEDVISMRISLIRKFLVIAACCLCIWPAVGLVMTVIAWLATRKTPARGWRRAAKVALIISIVAHLALGVIFLIDFLTTGKK